MIDTESIANELKTALPGCGIEFVANPSPSAQSSLLIQGTDLVAVAQWLKDHSEYRFDYLSNVTGVDHLEKTIKEKVKKTQVVDGEEQEVEETVEQTIPGYLEVVYHLYSMPLRHGPLILRARTGNRSNDVALPSLTPIWRSAEFQEREIFDLYGVTFDGHPDLRRLLMWDEFEDHPMRKDYVEPDDYEYEPTPHGPVLERANAHQTPPSTDAPSETQSD
tara:strand:- start:1964 stop:2623 length:660 start_codon:yes stop_codon:yes gene_type:complete